jgi:8-oxo-dGTP diphosphatase
MTEPEAAVAIVQAGGPEGSILLMRRAEREGDSWSGHWSLPGGRCELGDRDPVHTALRELEEECGVRLTERHLEKALAHTTARRKAPPYLLVAPFVFRVEAELPTTLDEREAVESLWIRVDTLRATNHHVMRAVPGRPAEMLFPTIELGGTPLWGFTYRLLTDWMNPTRELLPLGAAMASKIVSYLSELGMKVREEWQPVDGAQVAEVEGEIPVDEVLARFGGAGAHVLSMNMLEVRPDRIRMLGPSWEEYRIVPAGNF